jgi:hypothetical protein
LLGIEGPGTTWESRAGTHWDTGLPKTQGKAVIPADS